MSPERDAAIGGTGAEGWLAWLARRFELSRAGAGGNLRSMEGLRGLAVFLVFLAHYVSLFEASGEGIQAVAHVVGAIGNTGVDLFFVLSGFLIYGHLMDRPQAFFAFFRRRVRRIYPVFTLVFVVYVALAVAMPASGKLPADPWTYLLWNFLLLPGLFPITPLITVAWSLSYEMFYYAMVPLLIHAMRLRARTARWRMVFFALLGAALLFTGAPRLAMFVGGILLSETLRRVPGSVGVIGLAAAWIATQLPLGLAGRLAVQCIGFTCLCLACFGAPSGWLARAFCWTPLRWLGNMSYSYYLIHGLVLKTAFAMLPAHDHGAQAFGLVLVPMLALTLVVSAVLFLACERPWSLAPRR